MLLQKLQSLINEYLFPKPIEIKVVPVTHHYTLHELCVMVKDSFESNDDIRNRFDLISSTKINMILGLLHCKNEDEAIRDLSQIRKSFGQNGIDSFLEICNLLSFDQKNLFESIFDFKVDDNHLLNLCKLFKFSVNRVSHGFNRELYLKCRKDIADLFNDMLNSTNESEACSKLHDLKILRKDLIMSMDVLLKDVLTKDQVCLLQDIMAFEI
jgi:hypothetical protein